MFFFFLKMANQRPRCKQRGIKLAALQSSGVFDPRGSLARGNKFITHMHPSIDKEKETEIFRPSVIFCFLLSISRQNLPKPFDASWKECHSLKAHDEPALSAQMLPQSPESPPRLQPMFHMISISAVHQAVWHCFLSPYAYLDIQLLHLLR